MCQRPGTAWQKAWTRPSGLVERPIGGGEDDARTSRARGPSSPAPTTPTPTALAAWSPPPATTGVPARRPVAAAASALTDAGDLGPLERRRQPARGIDPSARQHLGRPVARGEVEQDRARAIGLVDRVLAGQPQADVVLGQQDVGRPAPDVGLVVADPHELGRGEAGQGVVAGDLDEPLGPDRRPDRVALGGGALVVPQDRRPEDAVGASSSTSPCICPVRPTAIDIRAGRPGRGQHARRSRRSPRPTTGPGPARSTAAAGRSKAYSALADADDGPGLVDQDGLRRRRRDVDAEDEAPRSAAGARLDRARARRPRCAG